MAKVKFIRLGKDLAVDVSKYRSYLSGGNIVFARVNVGAGTWEEDTSVYVAPSYYIWANGIEYHVADASALKYALTVAEQAASDISTLKGDDLSEGSIAKAIKDALDAYRPKAEHIALLVDTANSNVTLTVSDSSLEVNCEEATTTNTVKAAIKVGYLEKDTNIPVGTNIQELVDMIFNPDLGVTAVNPTASISNTSTSPGNYELGTTINVSLSAGYTDGYFKAVDSWGANQPANCVADMTNVVFKRGTTVVNAQDSYTLSSEGTAISYTATVPYAKSTTTPVSKKGNPLSDVSIAAGNATSGAITYRGYYRYYYTKTATTPLTASSTWAECIATCATNNLLTGSVSILGSNAESIGSAALKMYLYILIPTKKTTPTFLNELGNTGTMTVINNALVCPLNNETYKLMTTNIDGHSGDKYKNLTISK